MAINKKSQEMVFGYVFTFPIIVGVLVFTVLPMITSFCYSFTAYNPLEAAKNQISINLQDEIELQLSLSPREYADLESFSRAFLAQFDPVDFIGSGLGLDLDETRKALVRSHFETGKLAEDIWEGKLAQIEDGVSLLKRYLGSGGNQVFPGYSPRFVGLRNFVKMVSGDQYFWIVLWNTFFYALVVVTVQTFLSILLAVAADSEVRGVYAFKLIYFIPAITSSSAISMIFWMIYSKPGLLNQLLGTFGVAATDWLNNPSTALPAVMALNIWTTAGFFMVAFIAGLQNIPRELYEAGEIDGANGIQQFFLITIPMLRPQILYVMVMGTIGCMQVFDQIYYLTGTNMRTATMAFYIYKNAFFFGEMGYASAIAMVLFVIIFAMTAIQRRFVKESY